MKTFDKPTPLVTFRVDGRAVPWKVPTVVMSRRGKRRAFKDRTLVAWQSHVNTCARIAWGKKNKPYEGPVGMCLWFYVHPPTRQRVVTADVTNLAKAFEDGCKGAIIADDRQVFASHVERYFIEETEPQRAFAQFWAMPRGVIEPCEPGPFAFRPADWESCREDNMEELNAIGGHIRVVLRSLAEDASAARSLRLVGHSDRFDFLQENHKTNRDILNRLVEKYLGIVESEIHHKPEG